MAEPLTQAQIAALRVALARMATEPAERDVQFGLATIHRLLATLDAWRPVLEAVAQFDDDDSTDGAYQCHWCRASYVMAADFTPHAAECPVTRARALLETP